MSAGAKGAVYEWTSHAGSTPTPREVWRQSSPGVPGAVEAGDAFGTALAAADFNHDGRDDLAVGVPGEGIGSVHSAGVVNILNGCPSLVQAAMAHLNLVMIHPFRDGNGRMARCLQSLVLARSRLIAPVFMSIEEYLGRNTPEYSDVLARVGGGSWQPRRDARPWLRFSMTAHLRQAQTTLRRVRESERLWNELERLVDKYSLPSRTITLLYDAAMRLRVRNATYRAALKDADDEITEQTASRDLRQIVDAGLVVARGESRGRYYVAGKELHDIRKMIVDSRDHRDDSDPFAR